MELVLNIWLRASIRAHDFIEASFWESKLEDMRKIYIPDSENYVFEQNSVKIGFYSLMGSILAAIFVMPEFQGKGIGKKLLSHAIKQKPNLTLSVYKENIASYQFYCSQGFSVVHEQSDIHTGHLEYIMTNSCT